MYVAVLVSELLFILSRFIFDVKWRKSFVEEDQKWPAVYLPRFEITEINKVETS